MESASEALMMAFAVLVLVIALSTAMFMFSQAKTTSDTLLTFADRTYSYDYRFYNDNDATDTNGNRVVGLETIIPSLYRYYKEELTIVFMDARRAGRDITRATPMPIYTTNTDESRWSNSYIGYGSPGDVDYIEPSYSYKMKGNSKDIFVFDTNEEGARGEPWVGNTEQFKNNISCLISGSQNDFDGHVTPYNYAENELIKNVGSKYIEIIQKEKERSHNKTTKKSIITYIRIS